MATRKAFLLRMSETLYRELEAWAQEDLRSVNGQIEFLLRKAVLQRGAKLPEPGTGPETGEPGGDSPDSGADSGD